MTEALAEMHETLCQLPSLNHVEAVLSGLRACGFDAELCDVAWIGQVQARYFEEVEA